MNNIKNKQIRDVLLNIKKQKVKREKSEAKAKKKTEDDETKKVKKPKSEVPPDQQCKGLKKNKFKCGRKVKDNGDFCWQHEGQTIVPIVKRIYKAPIQHKIDDAKIDMKNAIEEKEYFEAKMKELDHDDEETISGLIKQKLIIEDFVKLIKKFEQEKSEMTQMEKSFKVLSVAKKLNSSVIYKEKSDEAIKAESEKELRRFQSKQRNYEYKKLVNSKSKYKVPVFPDDKEVLEGDDDE